MGLRKTSRVYLLMRSTKFDKKKSLPLLNELKELLDKSILQVLPKSVIGKVGEKLMLNIYKAFRFFKNDFIIISNF